MAQTQGRVPPYNEEAEVAVLGALMLDADALNRVLPYIRARDFHRSANGKVFECIVVLSDRSETPDLITVTEELRSRGELESVGGAGYIAALTAAVPTAANVEYYARIVRDASVRRRLLKISGTIAGNAYDEQQETRYIIEEAEQQIFEITDESQSEGYKPAREIIQRTIDAIERLYRSKDDYTGVPTGFSVLDKMTSGFQESEFIVIGARPSIGKTALALSMAANISIQQGIATGFFTLEMSDMAIMQRLVSSEARISSQRIRTGMLRPADFAHLVESAGLIYEAPLYIADTPNMKLLDLRAQARRMKQQGDVKIIFIDYISLIGSENHDIPRHEQIAEVSRSLKGLARELRIPIVALSQVNRDSEGKRPSLASIRESGSIEQDADVVIFLHRAREASDDQPVVETELILAKQRNGPIGTVKIAFVPEYTRFETLADDRG